MKGLNVQIARAATPVNVPAAPIAPVAPAAPAAPAPRTAADGSIEIRNLDDIKAFGPNQFPWTPFLRKYVGDLLALPGATSFTFQPSKPDIITVRFRTEAQRATGEGILEPAVEGTTLLTAMTDWAKGSPEPDTSLMHHMDMITDIDTLPGVYKWQVTSQPVYTGEGVVKFDVVDRATVEHLDPLIKDVLVGPTLDNIQWKYAVKWNVPSETPPPAAH